MVLIDYFEYATDADAQAAYVSSDPDAIKESNIIANQDCDNTLLAVQPSMGGDDSAIAQSLTATSSFYLTRCKFEIWTNGTPTGYLIARLYSVTGTVGTDAVPTGAPLASSDLVDIADVAGYGNLTTFNFSGTLYQIQNATDYCIAMEVYSSPDIGGSNRIKIGATSGNLFFGDSSQYGGGNWDIWNSSNDYVFYLYGLHLQDYSANVIKTQGSYSLKAWAESIGIETLNFGIADVDIEVGKSFYESPNAQPSQSFKANQGVLTKCSFALQRTGTRNGVNVYIELYSSTGGAGGVPTGSVLVTSNTQLFNDLPTSAALVDFIFSGSNRYELTEGNDYCIVVRLSDESYSTSNYLSTYGIANIYAYGTWSRWEGSWNTQSNAYDAAFRLYLSPANSLNKTLTHIFGSLLDLSGMDLIKFDIYAGRTGSNIKVEFYNATGIGYTIEHTPNILVSNDWQTETVDISAVSDGDKDNITTMIITVVDADDLNVFHLDNMYALIEQTKTVSAQADVKQLDVTKTISAKARIKQISITKTVSAKARIRYGVIKSEILTITETENAYYRIRETFNTLLYTLKKYSISIYTSLVTVLRSTKSYNTDFRTKNLLNSTINTNLRTRISDWDSIEPRKTTDFIAYLDGIEIADISYDTLKIDLRKGTSPSSANFTLARHHDDLDYMLDGTYSQITNLNKIVIYDGYNTFSGGLTVGITKLFTGYITQIQPDSDNDIIHIVAEDIRYKLALESFVTSDSPAHISTGSPDLGTPLDPPDDFWYGGKIEYPNDIQYRIYNKSVKTALLEVLTQIGSLIAGYDTITFGDFSPEYTETNDTYANLIDTLVRISGNIDWYIDENEYVRFVKIDEGNVKDLSLSYLNKARHPYEIISNNITLNRKGESYTTAVRVKLGKKIQKLWQNTGMINTWSLFGTREFYKGYTERVFFDFQSYFGGGTRYVGMNGILYAFFFGGAPILWSWIIAQCLYKYTSVDLPVEVVGIGTPYKTIDFSQYGIMVSNDHYQEVSYSSSTIAGRNQDEEDLSGKNQHEYLAHISEATYNLTSYAKNVAEQELNQLNKLQTTATVTLILDAVEYYKLSFKDRINLVNTIRPDIYKNQNGFPLHIDSISIDCSKRICTLNLTNYGKTGFIRTVSFLSGQSPRRMTLQQKYPRYYLTYLDNNRYSVEQRYD